MSQGKRKTYPKKKKKSLEFQINFLPLYEFQH